MSSDAQQEIQHWYREETVHFHDGTTTLVGTLSIPICFVPPHPAIAFIHGSGPASRSLWGPHRDEFTCRGFVTLTWDKPGVGDSTGDWTTQTGDERAQEGLAAIAFLKERHDIDAQRIGVCGASQAGWVMPLMCSSSNEIAFMIAISVPVGTGAEQNAFDLEQHLLADGWSQTDAKQATAYYTFILNLARNHVPYDLVVEAENLMKHEPWFEQRAAWFGQVGVGAGPDAYEGMKRNPDIYPRPMLEGIACPVLAIFGDRDLNVNTHESVEAYMARLQKTPHRDVTIKVYPGADHNICIRKADGTTAFAPGYFQLMGDWLQQRFATRQHT